MSDDVQTRDFFEQVLKAHWDLAACFCPVCIIGRALGFWPLGDVKVRPEMAEFAAVLHPFMDVARPLSVGIRGGTKPA